MYKSLTVAFAATLLCTLSATAQSGNDKFFEGLYLSADVGLEVGGDLYYGGSLGYRFQSNENLVFGVEGNFGDLTSSDSSGGVGAGINHTWGVTGILGYAFGNKDNNLVFVNAGYGEIDFSLSTATESLSEAFAGFRGGIGYEHAFSDLFSVRLVGTYQDISSLNEAYIGTLGFVIRF